MRQTDINKVFKLYREKFGVPLQVPPEYGLGAVTLSELIEYAREALRSGQPIDWAERLQPSPDWAVGGGVPWKPRLL